MKSLFLTFLFIAVAFSTKAQSQVEPLEEVMEKQLSSVKNGLSRGFFLETSVYGGVAADDDYTVFGAHFVRSFQFNPHIALGAGTGVRIYDADGVYVPLFLQFRANFINMKFSPFTDVAMGYLPAVAGGYDGGLFVNSSVGLARGLSDKQIRLSVFVDIFDQPIYEHYHYGFNNDPEDFYSRSRVSDLTITSGIKASFSF
ncbi:hypothetical protein [Sphingobacterium sp. LRF_L2]|uniref:hypothetical protein n=1 Tax=Sphingobacterium sp. LRF_L2 TaxID=3369421 RepID=UPI003F62AB12